MPTRAGRGYIYRGSPEDVSDFDSYNPPSGNAPFLATDAMFKIFDAPALDDIKRRLNMVAAGMPLESAFPSGSPQMQNFQKYYGDMPGSTTTAPGLFPGGVRSWTEQKIARNEPISESLAAATGMLRNQTAGQVLAPEATAELQQAKNEAKAQEQQRKQEHEELKQQTKQAHEKLLAAEKSANIDTRLERKIEAQAARQQANEATQRDLANQKDETKRRGQDMELQKSKEKFALDKIKIFSRVFAELEDSVGPEEGFRIAKDLGSGKSIDDLDLSPMGKEFVRRNINKSDEWHTAKLERAARAGAGGEGKADAKEIKLLGLELKLADSMTRLAKLAQSDPDAKQQLGNLNMLVREGHLLERTGDRAGARAVAKYIADKFGLEGVGEPGMFAKLFGMFNKPAATAETPRPQQVPSTSPPPEIGAGLQGVQERINQLRNPIAQPATPQVGPSSPRPIVPQPAPPRPGPALQQFTPVPQGSSSQPGLSTNQYFKGLDAANAYSKRPGATPAPSMPKGPVPPVQLPKTFEEWKKQRDAKYGGGR